jgi:cation diffusion facilitator CzcD-associated flavoprotein CzcO
MSWPGARTPSAHGSASGAPAPVEAIVVGAGFAGLAAAMALRDVGIDDVVVIERGASVGGTWRDNTYPGVACDVPSHLYGFARHPNPDWSGVYANGGEIHAYLERVAAAEGIAPWLNTPMLGAEWDADAELWRVRTGGAHAGELAASALVLACGRLTEPAIPEIPGLETFPGPLFHSVRWDHHVDLTGARIAVVGTGASAVQLVPELAKIADVTLFQRTPAWIVPRDARPYSLAERARFAADPALLARLRADLYLEGEARFAARAGEPDAAAAATSLALAHLAAQVPDAALRAALTPDYAFGCKRVLLSDEFYPALASGSVRLEASALVHADGSTLVARSGARYEVDAVVLATGFAATRQPYAELVRGEDATLAEHWARGMTSFASTVVSGFPNLFVLDGPNAALGHNSSALMLEEQAGYAARALVGRTGVLRPDPAAEAAYTAEIDRAAAATPWLTGGCRNWYVDERSGRLTLLWPGTVDAFRARLAATDGSEFLSSEFLSSGFLPVRTPGEPAGEWVTVDSADEWMLDAWGSADWAADDATVDEWTGVASPRLIANAKRGL